MSDSRPSHERAFEEFARRAQDRWGDSLRKSLLLGSTALGGTPGVDSDVDVFAVVETEAQAEESLGLAHEVGFAHGPMVSVRTQTVSRFEERRHCPFIRSVIRDGEADV